MMKWNKKVEVRISSGRGLMYRARRASVYEFLSRVRPAGAIHQAPTGYIIPRIIYSLHNATNHKTLEITPVIGRIRLHIRTVISQCNQCMRL